MKGVIALSEEVVQETPEMNEEELMGLLNYTLAQRYRNILRIDRNAPTAINGGYTKDRIFKWLKDPIHCERHLRMASRFLFDSNGQYRRLCNYQPNMVKFSYIIVPDSEVSNKEEDIEAYYKDYTATAYTLNMMNIRTEFNKLLNRATVDGVAFAYTKQTKDTFCVYMLHPDFCRMSSLDGTGCIRFEFNFSYFDRLMQDDREALLASYGDEFERKYRAYTSGTADMWQEIGEDGICIKYQEDILEYAIPPYIAVLDNLLDLDDYRKLAKVREENGNYNLLNFTIPTNKDGKILMDLKLVQRFIEQASSEVPDSIGILYSPMDVEKFNFAKDNVAETNAVNQAVQQFWEASGVSELLFGSGKSSSNALVKSIIADEINIYPLMRQIERWINRKLRLMRKRNKFRIKFLDVTSFNDEDTFDSLLKAGNSGVPVKNAIAATLGFTPYEILQMSALENDVLKMRDEIYNQPLLSASQTSSDILNGEAGRPEMDADDLSDEGEAAREGEKNIRE